MAKEEMTLTQKIKFKHIQGFYKVTVLFKTGNLKLLKGETVKMAKVKCIFCSTILMITENVMACQKNTFQLNFDSAGNNFIIHRTYVRSNDLFLLVGHFTNW